MPNVKWDRRFLKLASHVAQWSKDPSTRMGAVIVRPDRTIASVGFNGFPRGMSDDYRLYSDREIKYDRIIHCEMNAVLSAGESVKGYTLYTWPAASCSRCAVHMIQAGISRVVFPIIPDHLKVRWNAPLKEAKKYFEEAGVEWIEV